MLALRGNLGKLASSKRSAAPAMRDTQFSPTMRVAIIARWP
jgi:hypothetical protein